MREGVERGGEGLWAKIVHGHVVRDQLNRFTIANLRYNTQMTAPSATKSEHGERTGFIKTARVHIVELWAVALG